MSNKPRVPDYCECVTLLREQGLDDVGHSLPDDDPEHEDRLDYDGEMAAVQCGPLVGVYRVGRRRRAALAEPRPPAGLLCPPTN
jgi:hypothetical protein